MVTLKRSACSQRHSKRSRQRVSILLPQQWKMLMNTSKQLSRRTFLRGLGVSVALPMLNPLTALADIPSKEGLITRYPDPAVEVIDPRFAKYKIGNAVVERLWTGARWSEGPCLVRRWWVPPLERYSEQPDPEMAGSHR